jgi:hypothetical protein
MAQKPESNKPRFGGLLLSGSPGRTAARTTYHPYFLKDSNKLQLAHDPNPRISTPAFYADSSEAEN